MLLYWGAPQQYSHFRFVVLFGVMSFCLQISARFWLSGFGFWDFLEKRPLEYLGILGLFGTVSRTMFFLVDWVFVGGLSRNRLY